MLITTSAIVLHAIRYGESDLIVKLFTESSGLRSYLLKGVLKSKRGKIRASLFQPLTLIEIEANHKNKGTLERLREARLQQPFRTLHTDILKSSLVLFLSEILKNSIKEEEQNSSLYQYLENSFLWLDNHQHFSNFHLVFLLKLSQYLGFYPDNSTIDKPFFNLLEGHFQFEKIAPHCYAGEVVMFLKSFLGTTFDTSSTIKMSRKARSELLTLILTYFEVHLQGFKKPKSLHILNEIYQ